MESVSRNSASRENQPGTSETAAMTAAEMTALPRGQTRGFSSSAIVTAVRFFLEIAGVGRAINDARDRAGVLLDHAQTLVLADET